MALANMLWLLDVIDETDYDDLIGITDYLGEL